MTRMVARAYLVADALREAGIKVVMGGPHVTECPDEALGKDGGNRHADAVALGEADETWGLIVEDAANGELKEIYQPEIDAKGNDKKPALQPYPHIPWETLDFEQFSLVPKFLRPYLSKMGDGWGSFHVVPIETGRGCPYGCEFCTVTGFFGDSIRFRTNESVIEELLRLKERAKREKGQIAVFFIDDNLAINKKRVKSLLRDIIAADAQLPWVAQISANLLGDEELVDLIAESGGKWVFIGMESIDPENMASVNKNFSKPADYKAGARPSGETQYLRDYLVYFRNGQRHDGRRRAHGRTNRKLGARTACLRTTDAVSRDAALRAAGKRRKIVAPETLAGIRAFCDGAHACRK